jgi:DNA-binding transcriptional regulator GbsR (MarR family)
MDVSQREVDRILERLEQQDRTVERAITETKEVAKQIAAALEEHTKADHEQFQEINSKLTQVLEFQARLKGALNVFMVVAGAMSVAIGWLVSYFKA